MPATLNITATGALTYTAAAGETNNLSIGITGADYTFSDPGTPITLAAGATSKGFSVNGSTVTGPFAKVRSILVDVKDQADTVNVLQIASTTTITDTGGGSDIVNVGAAGNAQGIVKNLTVKTAFANTFIALNVDDSADAEAHVATISRSSIKGLVPATINFFKVSGLTLSGGSGGNTFNGATCTTPMTLIGGSGNDVLVGGAGADSLVGGTGNDALSGGAGNDMLDGGLGVNTIKESGNVNFTLTPTGLTGRGTDTFSNIQQASLLGGAGSNNLDSSTFAGPVTLNGAAGSDTLIAGAGVTVLTGGTGVNTLNGNASSIVAETGNITLSDTQVRLPGGRDILNGITQASLSAAAASAFVTPVTVFTVSNWTHTATLHGGAGVERVVYARDADFTLSNALLVANNGGGTFTLDQIDEASLTGGSSANTFTNTGWTHAATFNGGTGIDTVIASNDTDFALSNKLLSDAIGGRFTLNSIDVASLTGGTSDNTFDVSGWTSTTEVVSLDGGGGSDKLAAVADASFTLTDTTMVETKGTTPLASFEMVGIVKAQLTGGQSANTLNASTFTGEVTLSGAGGDDNITGPSGANKGALSGGSGINTLSGGSGAIASETGSNFTLTDSTLTFTDPFGLKGTDKLTVGTPADLTSFNPFGNSAVTFDVSGWTSAATLNGATFQDRVVSSNDADFTLTASKLTVAGGGVFTLNTIEEASLTGTGSTAHTFNDLGWKGTATFTGGTGVDTLASTNDTDFTLSNTLMTRADGATIALRSIDTARLTGGTLNNLFTVSGWTSKATTVTLDGGTGSDRIVSSNNANFTLTNTSLTRSTGGSFTLANMDEASLTGGSSANSLDASAFTGQATLIGGAGNDTLTGGVGSHVLTGGLGTNQLIGGGPLNTVVESGNANFTLSDSQLKLVGISGRLLGIDNFAPVSGLPSVRQASLTGGSGANTFTVDNWTGSASLVGGLGSDKVVSTRNTANYTLTNTGLSVADGASFLLDSIDLANLTGGAVGTTFDVSGWTQTGTVTLTGGSGNADTVVSTNNVDFTLTDKSLTRSTVGNFALAAIERAILTGGIGDNVFTVSGWSRNATLDGGSGLHDKVVSGNDANFTLTDTSLTRSSLTFTLINISDASLAGGASANTLDASAFTGKVTLEGGAGSDTVTGGSNNDVLSGGPGDDVINGGAGINTLAETGSGSGTMTLTPAGLSGSLGSDTLVNIQQASLTGGKGNDRIDATTFTGPTTLNGGAGNDTLLGGTGNDVLMGGPGKNSLDGGAGALEVNTVFESGDLNFTLGVSTVTLGTIGSDTLTNIQQASLLGGAGNNNFTVNGWTKPATLDGGLGSNRVTSPVDDNYILSSTSLTLANVGLPYTLVNIQEASLLGGSSNNTFDVSDWAGKATVKGGGGTNTILAVNDLSYSLSNSLFGNSLGGSVALVSIQQAELTGGTGNNIFTVTGWTQTASINGGAAGLDRIVCSDNANFTLTDTTLTRLVSGAPQGSFSLVNITEALLVGGSGNNTINASAYSGQATLNGGAGNDSLSAGSGSVTLTGAAGNDTLVGGTGTATVLESGDVNFDLSDTRLTGVGTDTLSNVGQADLTGGNGDNVFTVSGWTGKATLLGGSGNEVGNDTVVSSNDANFVLTNDSLTVTNHGSYTLKKINQASLAGGTGNNIFTVSDWTFNAALDGGLGTGDLVISTKDKDFDLSDALLTVTSGANFTLANFEQAQLTGGISDNKFTVSGWTHQATLDGGSAGSDTLISSTDANEFVLTDILLTQSTGGVFSLVNLDQAMLTGGPSDNFIDASAYSHLTTLSGGAGNDTILGGLCNDVLSGGLGDDVLNGGASTNTLAESADVDLTITNTRFTGLGSDTLSNIQQAQLTGGPSANVLDASAFTLGKVTLVGGDGNDTLFGGGGDDLLTGGTGSNSINGGGGSNTLSETADGIFTLNQNSLTYTTLTLVPIGSDSLTSIQQASLAGGLSDNVFNIGDFTGTATLKGSAGIDLVTAATDASFTLADAKLTVSTGGTFVFDSIDRVSLTGGASDNTFDVSGWTHAARLDGGLGTNTIAATKNSDFTLSNVALTTSDLGVFTLANFSNALLTGGTNDNTFNVTGWTGTGALDGGPGFRRGWTVMPPIDFFDVDNIKDRPDVDSVVSSADADFTLTNSSLTVSNGPTFTLYNIIEASLTGGPSNNTINVTGFSWKTTLTGGAGNDTILGGAGDDLLSGGTGDDNLNGGTGRNTLNESGNVDFVLTDTSLTGGLGSDVLDQIQQASLTGGQANNLIDASLFTGKVTLVGGAGNDSLRGGSSDDVLTGGADNDVLSGGAGLNTVAESADVNFILTDSSLSGFGTDTLTNVTQAKLTGGASNNVFTVSSWTGQATLDAGGGTADRVVSSNDTDFKLKNGELKVSGGGTFNLINVKQAELIGGGSANTFDLSGWDTFATLDGGNGTDTVLASSDADFVLSDSLLTMSTGGVFVLSDIQQAGLTGGGSDRNFTVSAWTGSATLDGGGGTKDVVISANDTNFVLSDSSLTTAGGAFGTFALTGVKSALLTGGSSDNLLDARGFSGVASLHGGGGNDTLLGGAGDDVLTGELGDDSLDGGCGTNTVSETANVNFTLTNSVLTGLGTDTLLNMQTALLTGGLAANILDTSAFSGPVTLDGGAGDDTLLGGTGNDVLTGGLGNDSLDGGGGLNTVVETGDVNFILQDTVLFGLGTDTLANITQARLKGGPADKTFTVSAWTGLATLEGNGGIDNLVASNDASFTLGDTLLKVSGGGTFTLQGFASAQLTGGASANTFDVSDWGGSGLVTLEGGGGIDTVLSSAAGDVVLTNTRLTTAGDFSLVGITQASLTGSGADEVFDVTGWTTANATLVGGGGFDAVKSSSDADVTLTDISLTRTAAGNPNGSFTLVNIGGGKLTGGASANLLEATLFSGKVTLDGGAGNDTLRAGAGHDLLTGGTGSNVLSGGAGTNTVVETGDQNYLLTDTSLTGGLGSNSLQDIQQASLTGGASPNLIDATAFTGNVTLAGGLSSDTLHGGSGNDVLSGAQGTNTLDGHGGLNTVSESANADFNLGTASLVFSDPQCILGTDNLSNIQLASLTGGSGDNVFTVTNWDSNATLTGNGGNDRVVAASATGVTDVAFRLKDTLLDLSCGGVFTLNAIKNATLTGDTGTNTFDVTDWTGSAVLDGAGGTDTIISVAVADFKLGNTLLTVGTGGNFGLSNIKQAQLTGGADGQKFTVSDWTGTATLDGVTSGPNPDVVIAKNDANFTLTGGTLTRLIGATPQGVFTLLNMTKAELTGGASANTINATGTPFTVVLDGGAGNDTLTGGSTSDSLIGGLGDDVINGGSGGFDILLESGDVDMTLTNTALTGGMGNDSLTNIDQALLIGAASANVLNASAFTIGNVGLYGGFGDDLLTGSSGNDLLSGGFGTNTLDGRGGTNLVHAAFFGEFEPGDIEDLVLSDGLLTITLPSIFFSQDTLSNITQASLESPTSIAQGDAIAARFIVSGWTGTASIFGTTIDTIISSKDANFTLTDTSLTLSTGPVFTLDGIGKASLTGGNSANVFTVTGWSGNASLDGGSGNDTVLAVGDNSYTLSDTKLVGAGTFALIGSSVELANLTGGASDNIFTVSDWTRNATLSGGGAATFDTVVSSNDVNFTLTNASLTRSTGPVFTLTAIGGAQLTGGTAANQITATAFTGQTTLKGGDGNDTLLGAAGNDILTGGQGNDNIDGGGGLVNTLIESGDFNFTLTGTILASTLSGGLGTDTLANIQEAKLTAGLSDNILDASGFSGNVSLDGGLCDDTLRGGTGNDSLTGGKDDDSIVGGGGNDTLIETGNVNFTLTNTQLAGLGTDVLSGIELASLTGGAGDNLFTVSNWTIAGNSATLVSGGGNDTVVSSNDTNFTLSSTTVPLPTLAVAGGATFTLNGIQQASLTGGAGANIFDLASAGSWSGKATLDGGAGSADNVIAAFAGNLGTITLSDALLASGGASYVLGNIEQANVTLTGQNNAIDVSAWTRTATIDGSNQLGNNVKSSNDANFTLAVNVLSRSTGGTFTINNMPGLNLSGGASANSIDVSAFAGQATLDGGAGNDTLSGGGGGADFITGGTGSNVVNGGGGTDTVVETANTGFTLTNTTLTFGPDSDGLTSIEQAKLSDGLGSNSLDASAFTLGNVTLDGGAGNDTLLGGSGDDFLTGGTGEDSLVGGGGSNTVAATGDVNFILTDTQLKGLGTDSLTAITRAKLTGGVGDNVFNLNGWTGLATLDGAAGVNTLIFGSSANMVLSDAGLTVGGVPTFEFLNSTFTRVILTALGAGGTTIDASGFGGKVTLIGGTGNDTLSSSKGGSLILGGAGNDNLSGNVASNIGRDILFGGSGSDTLVGGPEEDVLVAGTTANSLFNETSGAANLLALDAIMAEWGRLDTEAVYAIRVKDLFTCGLYHDTIFLNATTIANDGVADTLTGGPKLDWFLISALDTITDPNVPPGEIQSSIP